MKKILFLSVALFGYVFAGFDFSECSGSGTFEQKIDAFNGDYEKTVLVGTIPKGIKGLHIGLISDKDVDIRLYGKNGDKIVHWPKGILNGANKAIKDYKGVAVTYSGYNGVGGQRGHEVIDVKGTVPTEFTMKAFGYQSGYATVNYSWTGKKNCETGKGHGEFDQEVPSKSIALVGEIPKGIENVEVALTSNKDIDIQLYGEDGTAIVKWPDGVLNNQNKQELDYHGMQIEYSGYKGIDGHLGHEYIKLTGKTTEKLAMKVYGYATGSAHVKYSWGSKKLNLQDELDKNKALWDNNALSSNYRMVMSHKTGAMLLKSAALLTVDDNKIVDASYQATGEKISKDESSVLKTVEGLFELIQSEIDKKDDSTSPKNKLTVKYNSKYGYPEEVSIVSLPPISVFYHYTISKMMPKFFICTADYTPVCAKVIVPCTAAPCPTKEETFSNQCHMENNPYAKFLHKGECNVDNNGSVSTYETNITIKPKKVECMGLMISGTKCLQIQEKGSNIWDTVYSIKGLNYEEGYKYKVLAKVRKSDPNLMDAPPKFYTLIKIIKKDLVDDSTATACTKEYLPVCGITNPCPVGAACLVAPIYKTFGNMCMLKAAHAKFVSEGMCK